VQVMGDICKIAERAVVRLGEEQDDCSTALLIIEVEAKAVVRALYEIANQVSFINVHIDGTFRLSRVLGVVSSARVLL
jgi:hypothetical protein